MQHHFIASLTLSQHIQRAGRLFQPEAMSQATFLGLPFECRMRIYEYALDPQATSRLHPLFMIRKGHKGDSCCAHPLPSGPDVRRCQCATADIAMPLLRVNKQVFHEALPVLCAQSELRVRTPCSEGMAAPKEIVAVLGTLPAYAKPHFRQLLITGLSDITYDDLDWKSLAAISGYWQVATSQLPNLRDIRLHLDMTTTQLKAFKFRLWAFKGLSKVKKLKRVTLELHQSDQCLLPSDSWERKFMENTKTLVSSKLSKLLPGSVQLQVEIRAGKVAVIDLGQF